MTGVLIKDTGTHKGKIRVEARRECFMKVRLVLPQAKELLKAKEDPWHVSFPVTFRGSMALLAP